MRGRTNVVQRDYPFVKGDLVSAVVEGDAIGVGDFVEVVYTPQRTKLIDDSRMVKLNYTAGTGYTDSNIAVFNPIHFEMQEGYVCLIYTNDVPTIYFIKEENNALVVKDSLTFANNDCDQEICKLKDNLFCLVKKSQNGTANLTLYKIQNDQITLVYTLNYISLSSITSTYKFLSICKLNSSQMVLFVEASSGSSVPLQCYLHYYIVDFTDTTLTLNGSLKSLSTNTFNRYNQSTVRFDNFEDNKILISEYATVVREMINSNGTLSWSRNFNSGSRTNIITYGGRFLINENEVLFGLSTQPSGYVARYILDTPITFSPKKFATTTANGQTVDKILDDTFIAAFWSDYYKNIGIQVFQNDKSTGNLVESNQVTFSPNDKWTSSSTPTYLRASVFGVFLKFGNNIYYVYGDAREALGSTNNWDIYYQKLKFENNILTIGQESNKVKKFTGNSFALGFSKTAGSAGQTISVYKPST